MKTYSRLTLAFLLLILVVPQVGADAAPDNDTRVGYYPNGQKRYEIPYKNGKRDGRWTEWHKNGQKKSEEHYKNGKKDGPWVFWYENGQKKSEYHFKNGVQDGLETRWDEDGNKTKEVQYKDGTIVSRKEF